MSISWFAFEFSTLTSFDTLPNVSSLRREKRKPRLYQFPTHHTQVLCTCALAGERKTGNISPPHPTSPVSQLRTKKINKFEKQLVCWHTEDEEEGWPPSQKQCSHMIRASRTAFNYAQGKTDTETNFVVTVGFTTKVDHQTTSKIWLEFRNCLMIDLGRETDGNNEICLGVRFALCII